MLSQTFEDECLRSDKTDLLAQLQNLSYSLIFAYFSSHEKRASDKNK